MSGVWFVVCIPTEKYEKKLQHPEETKGQDKDNTSSPENNSHPNGTVRVDIHNEENNSKNLKCPKSPKIISTGEKKFEKNEKKGTDYEDDEKSLQWHLKDCLEKLAVFDAVWILSKEETFYQVFFPCEGPGVECDFVLQSLKNRGIGERGLSTVGIMPCDVFCRDYEENFEDDESGDENDEPVNEKKGKGFKAMQKEFLKSVTARLTVAQVVEQVRSNGTLCFDFLMFTCLASMIAALGLSENSSITIVAAMLVSPIMGPIMAFTFGLIIRDKKLIKMALRTELIGLSICLLSGFLFGFICGNFSETWGAGKWPTPEMAARGNLRSLWAGCLIALPSGAGVALSILQGNGASLVGVAISASLLPPTVNCGLLWGLAAIKTVRGLYQHNPVIYDIYNHTVKPALLPPDTYTPVYFPLMDKECAVLGIVSFLLTVVNIMCIIIAALLILKVKEVAPNTTEPAFSRFWKQDVKIARDYNKTLGNSDGEELGKQFLQEWANLNGLDPKVLNSDSEESRLTQMQTLRDIVEDAQADEVFKNIFLSVDGPAVEKVTRRLSVAPIAAGGQTSMMELGLNQSRGRRRSSIAPAEIYKNKQERMKKRRQSRATSVMDSVAEDEVDPPRVSNIPRKSVVYNRPLTNTESPYSLWPTKPRAQDSRFQVSPVDELGPLPNIRAGRPRRKSCYPAGVTPTTGSHHGPNSDNNHESVTTSF